MTNQEAITELMLIKARIKDWYGTAQAAIDKAIEVLEKEAKA